MHQRALRARGHLQIGDAPLQRKDLAQPLRIAARDGQRTDLEDWLLRGPAELAPLRQGYGRQGHGLRIDGVAVDFPGLGLRLEMPALRAGHQAKWQQERAEQYRI